MTPAHISIRTIPPVEMRYQTVGDWQMKGSTLMVTVADSGDPRTNAIVGLHEAIEAVLYLEWGGKEEDVDRFDETWCNDMKYDEAGDDPGAPYHKEHVLATIIERMLVREMGMSWEAHDMFIGIADKAVEKARKR